MGGCFPRREGFSKMAKEWYVLRVQAGREETVREALTRRIELAYCASSPHLAFRDQHNEQPRLLHMRRHACATPRYSSASDTRVHLLAGHSADSRSPAACGAPPASTRRRSSTAGVAGRSSWSLLLLWLAAMTSADSYVRSTHADKAAAALCVSPSVLCAHVQQPTCSRAMTLVAPKGSAPDPCFR